MKAILKKPGQAPEIVEVDNDLKALQEVVGGYIETFIFATDACVLCDEESRFKDAQFNMNFCRNSFFGNMLFVGINGDEFCDFPNIAFWMDRLV